MHVATIGGIPPHVLAHATARLHNAGTLLELRTATPARLEQAINLARSEALQAVAVLSGNEPARDALEHAMAGAAKLERAVSSPVDYRVPDVEALMRGAADDFDAGIQALAPHAMPSVDAPSITG